MVLCLFFHSCVLNLKKNLLLLIVHKLIFSTATSYFCLMFQVAHLYMHSCTHTYRSIEIEMFPPYYFSNSVGCDRKLCKNSEQDVSLFVSIIKYPYLFLPFFPSIDVPSAPVNMFTHTVFAQPALEMLAA